MLFVPNVFTYIDIGFATPIAYDNCISHFFANLFAKDFIAKMHIALKEAYETEYWLELLYSTDYLAENEFKSIFTDCRELTNILASILKTMKETK